MTLAQESRQTRTKAQPRLMMVTTYLSVTGGAETQVVNMATGLSRRGWDVEIVAMLPLSPPLPDFQGQPVRVKSLEMRRGVSGLTGFQRLLTEVRNRKPDVVHSHMTHASLLTRTARPFCPMPALICTLHGHKMYSVQAGGAAMRELAHRLTDGLADVTTAVSEAAGERYARVKAVSRKRLVVIPNGIPENAFAPDQSLRLQWRRSLRLGDQFVWLAVGRLEKVKDYATMLRAFSFTLEANHAQTLLIAGAGSQRSYLERLCEELGITASVRFLGTRTEVRELMQAADGFVLSSIFEGMPLVMLEAGLSGLPMVATRTGGNAEVLPYDQRAALVPPRQPRDLALAMQRLEHLSDSVRSGMAETARAFILSQFGMEKILDRWEELYARVLAQKGTPETMELSK